MYRWLVCAQFVVAASAGALAACSTEAAANNTANEAAANVPHQEPRVDIGRSPPRWEYSPDVERLLRHPVTASVYFCVGADGRASSKPTLSKSSGVTDLDRAALRWVSDASFIPATVDGKPAAGCSTFDVQFTPKG